MRPRAVAEVAAAIEHEESDSIVPNSHPNETVLLVLSDLSRLYGYSDSDSGQSTQKRRDVATSRKLGFYAARVVCMRTVTLRVLSDEVLARSKLMVLESGLGLEEAENSISASSRATPVRSGLIIEEL